MSRNRNRQKQKKQSIDIMDLLAVESTSDARKLLQQYGKQDAEDYSDLKLKLVDLYYNSNDKPAIEKKMVDMHPHKDWILKYSQPKIEKKEEVVVITPTKTDVEEKSNCSACEKRSYMDGISANQPMQIQKDNTPLIIASLVTLAIVAITLKRN